MKIYHVNSGRRFVQPYESDYAVLRRCLVANPGLPLTNIEKNLRNLVPNTALVVERIRNIQGIQKSKHDIQGLTLTYKRQCPMCAELLYHTDIYALPWLIKCPIHNCMLTFTCPTCRLPWPNQKELSNRDCPTCGVSSFRDIHTKIIPGIESMKYESIKSINEFVTEEKSKSINLQSNMGLPTPRINNTILGQTWWHDIDITHSLYPSFKIEHTRWHLSRNLKRLCIQCRKIHKKSSRMIEDELSHHYDQYHRLHDMNRLKWGYQIMIKLLKWTKDNTPRAHHIHITDYSYLSLEDIIIKRQICPFCAALSLWFYNYVSIYINGPRKYHKYKYDFLEKSGFVNFYSVGDPCVKVNQKNYKLDSLFTKWFYQRGLTISYISILKHIISLTDKIRQTSIKENRLLYIDHYVTREIFNEQLCSFEVASDQFIFYFEKDDVLSTYISPKVPGLVRTCNDYHRLIKDITGFRSELFRYDIGKEIFSEKSFHKLVTKYQNQIH